MKILQLHNRYRAHGGEDQVVEDERRSLIEHGHRVWCAYVDNSDLVGWPALLATAWRTSYSRRARDATRRLIARVRPDVVHVHNLFPRLSPALFDACIAEAVPAVMTLHNYRLLCANAIFLRDGRVCEECISGSAYRSVLHGCYRGSRLASLPVAHMIERHRRRDTWGSDVACLITLNAFARDRLVEAGIPRSRIEIKHNAVADPFDGEFAPPRDPGGEVRALFVGRLSAEKGLHTLLRAWRGLDVPLRIAGGGPLASLRDQREPNVRWLGPLPRARVFQEMRRASFLVFASEWYEGQPLVLLEAMAHGLAVISVRTAAMSELIEDGYNGILVDPGDITAFRAGVARLAADPALREHLGRNARRHFLTRFTPARSYRRLMEIYGRVVGQGAPRSGDR